jgi:hypothetical protein
LSIHRKELPGNRSLMLAVWPRIFEIKNSNFISFALLLQLILTLLPIPEFRRVLCDQDDLGTLCIYDHDGPQARCIEK